MSQKTKTYYRISLYDKGEGGLLFWYPPNIPPTLWGIEKGYAHLIRAGQAHKIFKSLHRRGLKVTRLSHKTESYVTATGDHMHCTINVFEAY